MSEQPAARADVRLLVPAMLAWAATAVALAAPTPTVVGAAVVLLVAAVLLAALGRGRRPCRAMLTACLLAVLGLASVLGHRGVERAGSVPALAAERATVTATARLVADPRLVGDGAERTQKVLLRVTVTSVEGRAHRSECATPVLVFADRSWLTTRWHDTVRLRGRLAPAEPGDDVAAVLSVRGPPEIVGTPGPVERLAEHVRSRLRSAVGGLPVDAQGLVPGLVIGDTSLTPPDLDAAMKATSLTHLSAVSGSNVSVVLAACLWVCGLVGVGRRARVVVALIALAGFVVLARPEPSVVRAAVMGAVGLIAVTSARERQGMPALGAAVVVLLVVDPWLARSFGFALSALATLGLLLFARPWGEAIGRRLPARLAGLGPALAIPLAAQVMCAPVTLALQPGVSVVGVPANLLAAPFVAPATMAGLAVAGIAVVWPGAATLLAWAAALPTLAVAQVARRAAALPGGSAPWPDGIPGIVLLVVVTLVLVLCGRRIVWTALVHPVAACCVLLVGVATAAPVGTLAWPAPGWTVVACDVGQGDGIVLRSGPGRAVLVDAGPDGDHVSGCLRRLGVEELDAVVLTHFHADHVTGFGRVLDELPVDALYTTIADEPRDQAQLVHRLADEHGLTTQTLHAGDRLDVGEVHASVLWPARVLHEGSVANNASIVLRADVAGTVALLTGDIEREAAHEVLLALRRSGEVTGVDVLKVAHHGSSNQDPQLIAELHAPLAVVSVGAGNDYGHPAPATVAALERAGSTMVRTDLCGDVALLGHAASLAVACRGP